MNAFFAFLSGVLLTVGLGLRWHRRKLKETVAAESSKRYINGLLVAQEVYSSHIRGMRKAWDQDKEERFVSGYKAGKIDGLVKGRIEGRMEGAQDYLDGEAQGLAGCQD